MTAVYDCAMVIIMSGVNVLSQCRFSGGDGRRSPGSPTSSSVDCQHREIVSLTTTFASLTTTFSSLLGLVQLSANNKQYNRLTAVT